MIGHGVLVTLTQPCSGPEVKGSAEYLTPTVVEWRVSRGGQVYAVVSGMGRKGTWARGAALYAMPADWWGVEPPEWLPIPHEWIEDARRLIEKHQSGDPEPTEGAG